MVSAVSAVVVVMVVEEAVGAGTGAAMGDSTVGSSAEARGVTVGASVGLMAKRSSSGAMLPLPSVVAKGSSGEADGGWRPRVVRRCTRKGEVLVKPTNTENIFALPRNLGLKRRQAHRELFVCLWGQLFTILFFVLTRKVLWNSHFSLFFKKNRERPLYVEELFFILLQSNHVLWTAQVTFKTCLGQRERLMEVFEKLTND